VLLPTKKICVLYEIVYTTTLIHAEKVASIVYVSIMITGAPNPFCCLYCALLGVKFRAANEERARKVAIVHILQRI
jgi:hypothetical protein